MGKLREVDDEARAIQSRLNTASSASLLDPTLIREGFTPVSTAEAWRMTNLRPGWAATGPGWREQADALDDADCGWLESQWEIAGGGGPELDMTWVTTETIGGGRLFGISDDSAFWPLALMVVAVVVCFGLPLLFVGGR